MTRSIYLISFVAVLAAAGVAAYLLLGGSSDPETLRTLTDQIRTQTEATRAAVALANDVWVPRIAGLGLGLSTGLLAGGVAAYVTWGGGR
jgi:hypothetical protein